MNEEAIKVAADFSAWHAIMSAGPVVKITFLILVFMSVYSWVVIFSKRQLFKDLFKKNSEFQDEFLNANTMDEIANESDKFKSSNMFDVFLTGFKEIKKIKGAEKENRTFLTKGETLERTLGNAVENQILKAEKGLAFLATTGSTAPFIGLFGTVWGIMSSFQKIGLMKSASLAVVAPGISEALIATAVGLAAAIPASIAYNHYVGKIKKLEHDLNTFASDLVNIAERNFF